MDKTGSVVVSGGFDPLHVGHVKMFQEATKLAARLIVIVNNDNFLMQKKGYAFMPIDERIEIIKNINVVDKVIESIDTDLTVCQTLNLLAKEENVKVFANGGDRRSEKDISETTVCKDNQIKMEFNIGGGKIQSSSSLVSQTVNKPWGSYKTFEKDKDYLVKIITVNPGEKLSLQSHQHRSEHWLIISGIATVECDGKISHLNRNESIFIPQGSKHRLSNENNETLKVFEAQYGETLSESDIIRYQDKYKRVE
jgi:cytidyltransferase-like protein